VINGGACRAGTEVPEKAGPGGSSGGYIMTLAEKRHPSLKKNILNKKRENLMRQMFRKVFVMVAALGCAMWLIGCTQIFSGTQSAESQAVAASAASVSVPAESRKKNAVYYDFEDVLIPVDLTVIQDGSMIVSTPWFTSGILALRGRVDRRSLINFFNSNMQKDNWSIVSQITSPKNAILVFEKPSKSAVIYIKSEHIYTYVEVGVAARFKQSTLSEDMGSLSASDLTQ
jgi:hypothetical protein